MVLSTWDATASQPAEEEEEEEPGLDAQNDSWPLGMCKNTR